MTSSWQIHSDKPANILVNIDHLKQISMKFVSSKCICSMADILLRLQCVDSCGRIRKSLHWVRWHLKSPASRLFTQTFVQGAKKTSKLCVTDLCHTMDMLWEKFQWILPLCMKPISFQSKASVVCSVTAAVFIDFSLEKLNVFSQRIGKTPNEYLNSTEQIPRN